MYTFCLPTEKTASLSLSLIIYINVPILHLFIIILLMLRRALYSRFEHIEQCLLVSPIIVLIRAAYAWLNGCF